MACCDLHNKLCEPPGDLCCEYCSEWLHPNHPFGVLCVLDEVPEGQLALEVPFDPYDEPHCGNELDHAPHTWRSWHAAKTAEPDSAQHCPGTPVDVVEIAMKHIGRWDVE